MHKNSSEAWEGMDIQSLFWSANFLLNALVASTRSISSNSGLSKASL